MSRRRTGRGEQEQVPPAEFRSYHGKPVIKAPAWKTPDVPLYLFLGGTAGASSVTGMLAAATGRRRLARIQYLTAAVGAAGGTVALIHDLGRPARFLYMLRVLRPTSPLSVGSWLLAPFGGLSAAAAASEVTGLAPAAGWLAKAGAAALGPAMTTYTAVLVADTAVPAWHDAYPELPFVFAGGALAGSAGAGLVGAPSQSGPLRATAVAGVGLELAAERRISRRLGMVAEPYHHGRPGRWLRAGRLLTSAGSLGALAGRRSRTVSVLSGAALLAGALCTRFGVFHAGTASAEDPKYTVVPQRRRLTAPTGG